MCQGFKNSVCSVQVHIMKWLVCFFIVVAVQNEVTVGLYFPKSMYSFQIPVGVKARTTFGRVYVLNNVTSMCDVSNITYMMYWPSEYSDKGSRLVDIDHVTGEVIVTNPEDGSSVGNTTLELSVNASCTDRLGQLEVAFVRVRIQEAMVQQHVPEPQHDSNDDWFETLCWRQEDQKYMIQENAYPLTFGDLRDIKPERLTTVYVVDKDSSSTLRLMINNLTSEMTLLTAMDRETTPAVEINVTCTVFNTSRVLRRLRTTVTITLIDVNDNAPVFKGNYINPQLAEISITEDGQKLSLMLEDADIGRQEQYEITVAGDHYGLVDKPHFEVMSVSKPITRSYLIPRVEAKLPVGGGPYTVDINIRDKGFQPQFNNKNQSDTLVTLSEIDGLGNYSQFHLQPSVTSPLAVTPGKGILYVKDEDLLQKHKHSVLRVLVDCQTSNASHFQINIQVQLGGAIAKGQRSCDGGCSQFNEQDSCTAGCGIGSHTRECMWRPGLANMSNFYETCTADRKTCPNGVCDELEDLNPYICPQDCTRVKIIGTGQPNSKTGRGISVAKGPCWCEGKSVQCQCWPDVGLVSRKTDPTSTERVTNVAGTVAEQRADDTGSCDSTCKVTVALTVVFVSTIGIVSVIALYIWRRRRTRRSQILKHVGSNVSMTALPSDYLEDREPRTSYHTNPSPQWSPKVTLPTLRTNLHVDKWEFPRENLHLEQTLGEGEFGQVVQAKALGINGDDKYATVAVKMLKPDATGSEYQDLWSELNLLKEVNHPNVIRLLGACTHNGPFYVVVEFCKHGSLKNFLRGARFKDRKSWDEKQDAELADSNRNEPTTILALRDLLSFAWQVAKGMGYLSNMKFVHRDLAARNVLVSDGRVLKISDFGLSRDVYEADAYLKMTKGRIPVKWMAPESLYAQIYTTKSDIWSFGILLWEIITLGANPYPGIAPERLFSLLRTGYRMDRPEDCPEEVYAIMQKCWKSEPEDRPNFSRLSDILDTMLQQREGYLDLTDNTAYMEERLNYLDSTDLHGEWDDDEEGYGSITVLRQGGDNYLTAVPECEVEPDEGQGEGEKGKLLPSPPKLKDSVNEWDSNKLPNAECGEKEWLLKERTISSMSKGKGWKDNPYEIHCV